jgi:hypothetical protein
VNPVLHVNEHVPTAQTAVALPTDVVQALPHPPQLVRSTAVFVHPPLQREGVDDGQPDEQAYGPASMAGGAQRGVPPSGSHAAPHAPQLADVVYETQPPPQGE